MYEVFMAECLCILEDILEHLIFFNIKYTVSLKIAKGILGVFQVQISWG